MKLKLLKYSEFDKKPIEWKLEGCTFDDINLIVGRNASGKSKILNIINSLALSLSRHLKLEYSSGNFEVQFDKNGKSIIYFLKYEDKRVIEEKLLVDKEPLMERSSDGTGLIYSHEFEREMKFQTPVNVLAASAKRDAIQHPFLEDLYNWADSLIHFYFGSSLGKDIVISFIENGLKTEQIDLKQTQRAIEIFKKGHDKFGDKFISSIKNDMSSINYDIDDIDIGPPTSIQIEGNLPSQPVCLLVKEADLKAHTDQNSMSQGMFRALSIIVQINYAQMASTPSCVLIDDIGEGLDYDRSTNLIKLIIEKAKNQSFQLIMSTNDRFVMNNVPLQYWSIVHRAGNKTVCFDYRNSPELFDEFESTGLNNFDFFSSNYFLKLVTKND